MSFSPDAVSHFCLSLFLINRVFSKKKKKNPCETRHLVKAHPDDFTLRARAGKKKLVFFPLSTGVNDGDFFWWLESSDGLSRRFCYGTRLHIGGAVWAKNGMWFRRVLTDILFVK